MMHEPVDVHPDEIGIDLTKQQPGTQILVETEDDQIFELTVVTPDRGIVDVSGTDARLHKVARGVLSHSFSTEPRNSTAEPKVQINHWIGKLLQMSLIFRNGNYESKPVIHATIRGKDTLGKKWSYDVF